MEEPPLKGIRAFAPPPTCFPQVFGCRTKLVHPIAIISTPGGPPNMAIGVVILEVTTIQHAKLPQCKKLNVVKVQYGGGETWSCQFLSATKIDRQATSCKDRCPEAKMNSLPSHDI
ncbi:hypothetical protein TNCV_2401191 [Trichonephila clavipes]|nr:hypothetical protein TNCV_2401191 [Trichonephila clavipes]